MVTDRQEDNLKIKTRLQRWPVQDPGTRSDGSQTQHVPRWWLRFSPGRSRTCPSLRQWEWPQPQLQLHRTRCEVLTGGQNITWSSDVQDPGDLPLTARLFRRPPSLSIAKAGRSPTIRQWFFCDLSNLVKHCQNTWIVHADQEKPIDNKDEWRFSNNTNLLKI